jgi:hypothetical protein
MTGKQETTIHGQAGQVKYQDLVRRGKLSLNGFSPEQRQRHKDSMGNT